MCTDTSNKNQLTYAVVLVSHNGMQYLGQQLHSIFGQTLKPQEIVVIDDGSTDGSVDYIRGNCLRAGIPISVFATDEKCKEDRPLTRNQVYERIGQNFRQGLLRVSDNCDVILFSDQDDVWLPHRAAHQIARLQEDTRILMTGADATLLCETSTGATRETLFRHFGVPERWNQIGLREQMRMLLQKPFVTGATAAVRRSFAVEFSVPRPWLHDRWLSLAAASQGGLDLDPAVLVQYRVHSDQTAGLSRSMTLLAMMAPKRCLESMYLGSMKLKTLFQLRRRTQMPLRDELSPIRVLSDIARRNSI